MTKGKFLILLSLIFVLNLRGQQIVVNSFSDSTNSQVSIYSHIDLNSTGLSNGVINEAYSGEVLTTDRIIDGLNTLNKNNSAGLEFVTDGFYQKEVQEKKINFYKIGLKKRQFISFNFTEDFIGLLALGNSSFEDKTANLKSSFKNFNYQGIYYGIGKNVNKKLSIEVQAAALVGTKYQSFNIEKGELYTAPYGEFLEATLKGNYNKSNKYSTGLGAAISTMFNYMISQKSNLKLGIYDLGLMSWSNTTVINVDSNYYFDGFSIDNLFEPTSFTTSNLKIDSINSIIGLNESNKIKNVALPGYIFLTFQNRINSKISLELGLQSLYDLKTSNFVYGKVTYNVKDDFQISPILSYGGFGGLNFGADFSKRIKDKLKIDFGTRFIDGIALYNLKSGVGCTVKISYNLNSLKPTNSTE